MCVVLSSRGGVLARVRVTMKRLFGPPIETEQQDGRLAYSHAMRTQGVEEVQLHVLLILASDEN
jgi:hypothetical protein